ncbi:MAG: RedB protein [Candidatus Binataceae bacterium]
MNWRRSLIPALGLALWLGAVTAGTGILYKYSVTPGVAGTPGAQWPSASTIPFTAAPFTLVIVIHPHCPCSRASIGELAILMAHTGGKLAADVVFVEPPGFCERWTKTDLWSSAGSIPGVTRIIDRGGEAKLFGAATSGQTMVYDRNGRLRFSGGITVARGHYGDNDGVSAILATLGAPSGVSRDKPIAYQTKTEVYGCPLFAAASNQKIEQRTCRK